jgi:AcrR family transcriptional regulator
MPALSKTSDDAIAEAARRLIEEAREDFSMAAVAEAVGVRTPSLYKRYADREALLARVRRDAYDALRAAIAGPASEGKGGARIRAMALAYRRFALEHPKLYALLFAPEERADEATQRARVASAAPLLEILRDIAGPDDALSAARTLTAFLHGYVTMLNAGAFKLGGDVDAAFVYGLDRILAGIAAKTGSRTARKSRSSA